MGKLTNGIFGGFRGKAGPVVGYYLNGEAHIRARPVKKHFSAAEKVNHGKFKLVQDHLLPIRDLLKIGFKNAYTKTGGYRGAVSCNRKEALVTDASGFYFDAALLKFSYGDLPGAADAGVVLLPPGMEGQQARLQFTWESPVDECCEDFDQLMVLVYDIENSTAIEVGLEGPFRKDGVYQLQVPDTFIGKTVHVYIGFVSKERDRQSISEYLGRLTVPG